MNAILIAIVLLLILLFIGQSRNAALMKKKLENDERIINRLDIIWQEMKQSSKDGNDPERGNKQ